MTEYDDDIPIKRNKTMGLIEAVLKHDFDMVNMMVRNSCDVNVQDIKGNTPLHYATLHNDFEITSLLVEYNASLYIKNWIGRLPIHHAAMCGNIDMFEYITEYNSMYQEEDNDGMTPFAFACLHGHLEIVKYMVEEQTVVPSLLYACEGGHDDIIKYLVSKGGVPCIQCLYYVIKNKNVSMFQLLIPRFDGVNSKHNNMNVIQMIAKHGVDDMFSVLQDRMREVNQVNRLSNALDKFTL